MRAAGGLYSEEIAAAWAQWLGQEPFDLFDTVTSAKRTHPESMGKRVVWFIGLMNDHYFGKRWRKRPWKAIQYAIAIERHKSGNPHAHALLRFPAGLPRDFPLQHWQDICTKSGGWSKLELPRSQVDVVDYCAKYLIKGGEILLSPNFRPVRAQPDMFPVKAADGARFRVEHRQQCDARVRAMLEAEGESELEAAASPAAVEDESASFR